MHENDRQAIEGVFARLTEVSRTAPPRDRDAEMYINRKMQATDGSAYFLAQTVVMQEQALQAAQDRIADLEYALQHQSRQQAQPQGGGFLSRMFGGQQNHNAVPPQRPMHQPQGGGFLAGAAQTAVGVAGGMMLGNMLGSMFAGEAQAAEPEMQPFEEDFAAPEEEADFGEW